MVSCSCLAEQKKKLIVFACYILLNQKMDDYENKNLNLKKNVIKHYLYDTLVLI